VEQARVTDTEELEKVMILRLIGADTLLALTKREAEYVRMYPPGGLMSDIFDWMDSHQESAPETYAFLAEWVEIMTKIAELVHRQVSFVERLVGEEEALNSLAPDNGN